MQIVSDIEDLRKIAARRVPKMFYDFVDSGSWSEQTYRSNQACFREILLRQRVGRSIDGRSLKTSMIGVDVSMPVGIAPIGLAGMIHADGEILAARAAQSAGGRYTLSTLSISSLEDIQAATRAPFWFQLYVMRDKQFMLSLIDRAKAAGCDALILTLDLSVLGNRFKDAKNGLSTPPKLTLSSITNMLTKPRWCMGMVRTHRRNLGNIIGHAKGVGDVHSLAAWVGQQLNPCLSWHDIEWIKERWGGKLVIKGILDADDAQTAVAAGVDAIIVSNHGGRQLDGAPASVSVLPEIVDRVGGEIEVWIDSGIRSGQDVLKAVALGAKGALIGRAHLWGLGAYGEKGVRLALELIRRELDLTMAFCGHTDIACVDRSVLVDRTVSSMLRRADTRSYPEAARAFSDSDLPGSHQVLEGQAVQGVEATRAD
ncbi:L-lactate dehydrogenase LldA [Paraburkholderia jirisanensis]